MIESLTLRTGTKISLIFQIQRGLHGTTKRMVAIITSYRTMKWWTTSIPMNTSNMVNIHIVLLRFLPTSSFLNRRYARERNVRNEARDDPENSRRGEGGDIGRRAPSLESVAYSRVRALCSFHRCSSVRKYHRCK